jgi:MSHA biogenesis protein MshG
MYHYEATDQTGKTLVGSMNGKDEGAVRARLIQNGFNPLLVEPPAGARSAGRPPAGPTGAPLPGNTAYTFAPKGSGERSARRLSVLVPHRELAQFYRQMASMTKGGVPLPQALAQIRSHARNKALRSAVEDIEATVERGRPVSEAMDRHPRAFSPGHVGLVKSGEGAGYLDRAFDELSRQCSSDWGMQTATRFNPLLFLIKAVGFPFLVMWAYFMMNLPHWQARPDLIRYYLEHAVIAGAGAVVIVIVFFPTLSHLVRMSPLGKVIENAVMLIPGVNARRKRVDRVKALGSLSSSLGAGVPGSIAWELATEASETDRFERIMRVQLPLVRQGASFPEAMERSGLFTPQIMDLAHAGELSGNLPEMLSEAASFEREEAKAIGNLMPWVFAVAAYLIFMLVAAYFVISAAGSVYGGMLE